jgi:hypothetical protein
MATCINGDIPRFLANGDGPSGLWWRRRAVGSAGQRGRLGQHAAPAHGGLSLRPQVARASKISGRKFSAAARQNPTGLNVCKSGALIGTTAARTGFLLAALHSVAKRVRHGQAYHPTRYVPAGPPTRPHASAATVGSSVPEFEPSRRVPEGGKDHKILTSGSSQGRESSTRFSAETNGHTLRSLTRGSCGVGGRAVRGLTRSATEWSAARRKPVRAAAMHRGAANFADVKARRLPTSDRRKFPSGNFRSARDFEGAERVNPRKARASTSQPYPLHGPQA